MRNVAVFYLIVVFFCFIYVYAPPPRNSKQKHLLSQLHIFHFFSQIWFLNHFLIGSLTEKLAIESVLPCFSKVPGCSVLKIEIWIWRIEFEMFCHQNLNFHFDYYQTEFDTLHIKSSHGVKFHFDLIQIQNFTYKYK